MPSPARKDGDIENMENKTIGVIIVSAIVIIIGVVLAQSVADQTSESGFLSSNDTIDITSARFYSWSGGISINHETLSAVDNVTGEDLSVAGLGHVVCIIKNITNSTDGAVLTAGNYTVANCNIKTTDLSEYLGRDMNVSYIYNWTTQYGGINHTYPFTLANAVYSGGITSFSECNVTSITLKNQTGDTLTEGTDYEFRDTTAVLTFNNTAAVNASSKNITSAQYSYCKDKYIGGIGKTFIDLIPLLFIIGLIGMALWYSYDNLKENGII